METTTIPAILQTLGGIGLFLLGMVVMSEGLRALAGDALRYALMRFTRSPMSGAITGAVSTAILQSSSAVTVVAVGFVGAGLMGFSESLGIIFGANIGTTITGWLVALLGFKFKLGTIFLPLILIGALLRLFGRGRLSHTGYALAGFGLIFVGIDHLQQGMAGLQAFLRPDTFPADTWIGRLQLVLLGILITIVTQSSSAGVATALTALYAGAINFSQAAVLVIGMDVGTTVTAAMATIGGSVAARRTGFSHVIYNVFTGVGALFLITPFIYIWQRITVDAIDSSAQLALVAFHTLFNTLGVIAILPFTRRYGAFMQKVIKDKYPVYTQRLDKRLLSEPGIALLTVQAVIQEELIALFRHSRAVLYGESWKQIDIDSLREALDSVTAYLDAIHIADPSDVKSTQLVELLHTLDHMQRLYERCEEEENYIIAARESGLFTEQIRTMVQILQQVLEDIELGSWSEAQKRSAQVHAEMQQWESEFRNTVISRMGKGEVDVPTGALYLDSLRWLTRVSRHVMQITHHFGNAVLSAAK